MRSRRVKSCVRSPRVEIMLCAVPMGEELCAVPTGWELEVMLCAIPSWVVEKWRYWYVCSPEGWWGYLCSLMGWDGNTDIILYLWIKCDDWFLWFVLEYYLFNNSMVNMNWITLRLIPLVNWRSWWISCISTSFVV